MPRKCPRAENEQLTAALRLLMLLLLPALSWAGSLPLPIGQAQVLPGPYMQYWKDPSGSADFTDVRNLPDSAWQEVGRRDASFGYGGSAYWLRLDVHNPHPRSLGWVLLVGNPCSISWMPTAWTASVSTVPATSVRSTGAGSSIASCCCRCRSDLAKSAASGCACRLRARPTSAPA